MASRDANEVRGPGRAIGRDIAGGERADLELERFISKRHEQRVKDEGERAAPGGGA